MNPHAVSAKSPHNPRFILMEWLETIQTPETETSIPTIGKKRKAVVVPKEEAVSDEEPDGSGVIDDAELKTFQVRPSSILSSPEVAESSKVTDEPVPGMRQVASQSAPCPHLTLKNSAEMIHSPAIVLPAAPKKPKAEVISVKGVVSDEELPKSGVKYDAELKELQALQARPSSIFLLIKFTMINRKSCGPLDRSK